MLFSGIARPRHARACVLPWTSQALPSPAQKESHDFLYNESDRKKMHDLYYYASISVSMLQYIVIKLIN